MVTLQDFVHRLRQKLEKHLSDNNQIGHLWEFQNLSLSKRDLEQNVSCESEFYLYENT